MEKVVGLFGYPVGHSLSSIFQNAGFRRLGLDFTYLLFSIKPKKLKKAVEGIKSLNIVGMNITIPHKEKVMLHLDKISPEAKKIGAVNTIFNKNGKLIGYNTDVNGFLASLQEDLKFNPRGKSVFLLGAGGVAYAITYALITKGVKGITIVNKPRWMAELLVKHFRKIAKGCEFNLVDFNRRNNKRLVEDSDILINATSVGMNPGDVSLIKEELLYPGLLVFDVVYNRETSLLKLAKKKGLNAIGGLNMLIHQGAASFEIWTGEKAPIKTMRKAAENALKKQNNK